MDVTSAGIIFACSGFIAWAAYAVFYQNYVRIYAENGLIETAQAVLLIVASLVYMVTAVTDKRSDKLIIMFCSLLCLSFFLREIDLEKMNVPSALIFVGSGIGRNTLLVIAFLAIIICALREYACYKQAAFSFLKSRAGYLLIAGGVFLWVGDFFEVVSPIERHNVFIEEINELVAYVLILLSSIAANAFLSGRPVAAGAQRSG